MPLPKTSAESGSLMLELCIALALYSLIIVGLYGGISTIIRSSTDIQEGRIASYEAQRILENAIANSFETRVSTSTITIEHPEFEEALTVANMTPCEQAIMASISWQTGEVLHSRNLTYVSTDPAEYAYTGNDCQGLPHFTSSANNTGSTSSSTLSLVQNSSLSLPSQTTSGDMLNGYLYIGSASGTEAVQNTDFYLLDEHNPQKIIETSSLLGPGLRSIDAIPHTVYAAANGTSSQLVIIDTANPSHPFIAATSSLPGVAPTGSYPGGTSVYYYNSRVYVGTHRTAGNEFHIYDVTKPSTPIWLGSIELNHNINAIIVRDTIAYLGTSGNTKNIIILDVSNPAHILELSALAFVGNEDTLSIHLLGQYLYVGRAKATALGQPEFNILDISNPDSPQLVGSLAMNDAVNSIEVSGNKAYLALANNKLAVVDVSTPGKPALISTIGLSDSPQALDFENNTMSITLKKSVKLANF